MDLASYHFLRIECVGGNDILENLWTPVDCLKSVLIPLSRGIACEGNIFIFFSLWIVDQCAREEPEHDGGFFRAFLSTYQGDLFK